LGWGGGRPHFDSRILNGTAGRPETASGGTLSVKTLREIVEKPSRPGFLPFTNRSAGHQPARRSPEKQQKSKSYFDGRSKLPKKGKYH